MKKVKIAILGYGTIGKGVVNICLQKKDIEVVKIFEYKEKFDKQYHNLFTDNLNDIIYNDEIDIVVEVLGGYDFAKKVSILVLNSKKHLITANKEVVAKDIDELTELARLNGVSFCYEASVGGAIPIIKNIKELTQVNTIHRITGILNGTTNYILTKMTQGFGFDEALVEAKEKGFAENNPVSDLEGYDMMRKIAILSDLAWNTKIDINDIIRLPITSIKESDIVIASKNNQVIKYGCESIKNGNNILIHVKPITFGKQDIFSNINNEYNMVMVETTPGEKFSFIGKGAGSLPTASAIVGDMYDIMNGRVLDIYQNSNKYLINKRG